MIRSRRSISRQVAAMIPLLVLLLSAASRLYAQQVIEESWNRNLMMGTPAGYTHEIVRSLEENGRALYQTWNESRLTIKRMGVTVSIHFEMEMVEDAATGRLVRASQVMDFSDRPTISHITVQGERATLETTTGKRTQTTEIEWDPEICGPQYQNRTMREAGASPGKAFSFKVYTFDIGQITTQHYEIMDYQTIDILGKERRLLHLKSSLEAMGFIVSDEWRDEELRLVKSHVVQAGMQLDTIRCSREEALVDAGEMQAEVFNPLSPQANIMLPDPYHTDELILRLRPLDPELGLPDFSFDRRQTVEERGADGSVKLRIESLVPPPSGHGTRPLDHPPAEVAVDLAPTPFLQSDDPAIIAAAQGAIQGETDAWKAAQRLERFVYEHIDKKGLDVAFATAREVLDTGQGDCSEHGVLLAALCRAAGIPSRVALGLLYFNGAFGGHMWAEVWIHGAWYALDGTLGQGRVDATHLAMDVSSLESTGLAESMMGMLHGLGNLSISIEGFRHGKDRVSVEPGRKPYALEGRRYTNPINGLSLECPEGWSYTQLDPKGIKPVLLRMAPAPAAGTDASAGGPGLTVRVIYGASDSPLERAAHGMRARLTHKDLDVVRRIDGRDGRLLAGRTKGGEAAIAYVAANDAAFLFSCNVTTSGRKPLEWLIEVLSTVDFDLTPGDVREP